MSVTAENLDPIARQARTRPDKLALVELATGARLTYAGLDRLVDSIAIWLRSHLGDGHGERIAWLGRNSAALVATAYAAQRLGQIFVPLNWRLAAPEIADLLADCTPRLVIADTEFLPLLPRGTSAIESETLRDLRDTPAVALAPHDTNRPIILLYTSGTTGRPKGVIVTAGNADAASRNFSAVGEITPGSVTLSDLPMFHTIGLVAVARTTLGVGGTLVVSDRFLPSRTLAALSDTGLGATHYFAVPVMIEALERDPAFDATALAKLHAIFVGGAPVAPALVERFLAHDVPLVNGYGMSEAGTAIHIPIDYDTVRASAGALGRPAPEVEVRLVGDGRDVADGEPGEVWLRGPSVTPGYWNRPADTAAAFTDGWYRTGDLARRDADGIYWIVDRLKDMYVSGGENVYPAEIEAVLCAHSGIADAAVIGIPDARWGESGLAFVVPRAGTILDAAQLSAHCRARLAGYKCPSRFVLVDALPRSPAGKLLKPTLRQRFNSGEFS